MFQFPLLQLISITNFFLMTIGQSERETQNRVIALFRDELGYRYLGDWTDRPSNSNIDDGLLTAYLSRNGYTPVQISKAIHEIRIEANNPNRSLYDNNRKIYSLIHFGVPVKAAVGEHTETVKLINREHPELNDFAIAEEVTVCGMHDKRPDIVLYVNGIAVGVLELKNSRISLGDGIRQSLVNQRSEFIAPFNSPVHFCRKRFGRIEVWDYRHGREVFSAMEGG